MKIAMIPHADKVHEGTSGIDRVVEAYFRYLPQFGFEMAAPDDAEYDLLAVHAGTTGGKCDVSHLHGLHWTADFPAPKWQFEVNRQIVEACRHAKAITVPSDWVAETIRRDLRVNPHVIPHGIDWAEWQHNEVDGGYVLWNKNRGDPHVCDPLPVLDLALAFEKQHFVTTFLQRSLDLPTNISIIGRVPFDQMKQLVQAASVYLATTKESWGIGILEAMASGVPVLGYAHGGIVDLVEHGVSGFLAKPGDVEGLAEGLNYCLEHRATLGANGREQARAWTWQAAVEKVAGVYRTVGQDEPPTVGVVIPVFNKSEEEIGRAIESVLNQTYEAYTIIVVDDGSDDEAGTRRCVERYSSSGKVEFVRQHNQGVAIARNTGIGRCDTKYTCCLDSDDRIAPDFLQVCVGALEADRSLGIAYTGLYYHKPDGEEGLSTWPGIWDFDAQLERQNQVPTCCVFRREMWQRLGGYRQRYAPKGAGSEDAEFFTRAGAYGWKASLVEPHASVLPIYHEMRGKLQRPPTDEEMGKYGQSKTWPACKESFFHYSWLSGQVTGDPEYREMDWLALKPWVDDEQYPFASYATPQKFSHPVRQYDQPLVSVIIPVGPGHDKNVIDALDSLEGQTFRNWECIVVWDGPGFAENDTVKAVERAYPYVKFSSVSAYEQDEGYGAGWARNRGAEIARAPFLLFLDADDWLYDMQALDKMLAAWQAYQAIPYSDYVGRAFISDPEEIKKLSDGKRLIAYEEHNNEALTKHAAFPFDCERVLRQPEGVNPYIFCLNTCLVPRVWHDEIGGYDEDMPSWEDVDYHWRHVRAGHCYHHIQEALILYRFYTGTRRDEGCKIHQNLVQYLVEKYEKDGDPEMCKGCGGRRKTTNPKSTTQRAFASSRQMPTSQAVQAPAGIGIRDEDLIEVIFDDGNIGQHAIIGANATNPMTGRRFQYGDGKSGDKILVHRDDVYITDRNTGRPRIIDQRFRPIEPKQAAPPPEPKQELPPPVALVEEATQVEVVADEGYSSVTHVINSDGALVPKENIMPTTQTDKWASVAIGGERIDLSPGDEVEVRFNKEETLGFDVKAEKAAFSFQVLPGITPDIEAQLRALNLEGPEDILTFGIEGLKTIKGIGPKRADGIIAAIEARQ